MINKTVTICPDPLVYSPISTLKYMDVNLVVTDVDANGNTSKDPIEYFNMLNQYVLGQRNYC